MRSVESEGDSIDEAIRNALRILRLERERVEIEILSDATRGLFGFGGKKARVRATVRAPLSTFADEPPQPPPVSRGTGPAADVLTAPPAAPAPRTAEAPETGSRPTRAHPRPRPGASPAAPRPSRPGAPPAPRSAAEPAVSAESLDKATRFLEALLGHLGVACRVEARRDSTGAVLLDVIGDGGGLVIGRRGQTLDAIEYVVNRVLGRQDEAGTGRVLIDAERYRERRREYLEELARRLAEKVRKTGRPVTLNPMSPRDRRTVHLALRDGSGVLTRSQGDGFFRKLIVLPAGGGRRPRPNREPD